MESNVQPNSKPPRKPYVQIMALLLFLVVMPLGSWYYLSTGLDYQKVARAELKDYGKLPAFSLLNQNDFPITRDSLNGNMLLASFFRLDGPENAERFRMLRALHEQFDDRPDVWFVQHTLSPAAAGGAELKAFAKTVDLAEEGQCIYLNGSPEQTAQLLREGYHIPEAGMPKDDAGKLKIAADLPAELKDYPYFVLVDDEGVIRNYYDYRDPGQMKRLVEHMAILMPR
ncbi:MAG: hypothetical protein AAFW73_05880 [Bacteroidota bacterium]